MSFPAILIHGDDQTERVLQEVAVGILQADIGVTTEASAGVAVAQIASFTPVGAGKGAGLRSKWRWSVRRLGELKWLGKIDNTESHTTYVEHGTRPHMPPVAPLELWGQVVLGIDGLGWALALTIAERGTRAYGMVHQGTRAATPMIYRLFAQLPERVARRINVALGN
jgi:hypothetical protein